MNIFIATINGKEAVLTAEESWHCAKVLRQQSGNPIRLIDGNGNFYEGVLSLVHPKNCTATITNGPIKQEPRSWHLHLAVAPTKQIDRLEWLLEKAVEIGIDEISFIHCQHSERSALKLERMVKIVESAVKQSLQARIPKVNALVPVNELLTQSKEELKLIAHCATTPKKNLNAFNFSGHRTLVLIGPEGDFSEEEVQAAQQLGFNSVGLGPNRLRTETAALYACQAVSILSMQKQ